jgi:hypothetical protein
MSSNLQLERMDMRLKKLEELIAHCLLLAEGKDG